MVRAKPILIDGDNGPPRVDPDEFERIQKMTLKEILEDARLGLVRELLLKVNNHEITAAEMAVLRNLLRDNGLIMGLGQDMAEEGGGSIAEAMSFHLPEFNTDDDAEE